MMEGTPLGLRDGFADGKVEGTVLGPADGIWLGLADGDLDGLAVGGKQVWQKGPTGEALRSGLAVLRQAVP